MTQMPHMRQVGLVGVFDVDYLPAEISLRVIFDEIQRRIGDDVEISVFSPCGDAARRNWPSYKPIFSIEPYPLSSSGPSRLDAIVLAPGESFSGADGAGAGAVVIEIGSELDLGEILSLSRRCSDQSDLADTVDLLIESGSVPAGPVILVIGASEQTDSWWETASEMSRERDATLLVVNPDGSASTVEFEGVVALPAMADATRLLAVINAAELVVTDDQPTAHAIECMGTPTIGTTGIADHDAKLTKPILESSTAGSRKVDAGFDRIADAVISALATRSDPLAIDPADLLERIRVLTEMNGVLRSRLSEERFLMGQKLVEQRKLAAELSTSARRRSAETDELKWRLDSSSDAIRDLQLTRRRSVPGPKPVGSRIRRAIRNPRVALRYLINKIR